MRFFWGGHFEFFKLAILIFFCFISVKKAALSYEVSFFLHYGWFFQNLGKEAVWTFMHTTVAKNMSLSLKKLCQQLFVFKSLLTSPSNVLPLHLKQTFPPMIWIFTEGEGDGIESRLAFKIFSTLWLYFLQLRKAQMLLYHLSSFKLLRWWHTNLGVCTSRNRRWFVLVWVLYCTIT